MKSDERKAVDLDILKGKKIMSVEIQRVKDKEPQADFSDRVIFTLEGGKRYSLENKKDYEEDVILDQISGHFPGILNAKILTTNKRRTNIYRRSHFQNVEIFTLTTKEHRVEFHFFCIQLDGFEAESVDLVEVKPRCAFGMDWGYGESSVCRAKPLPKKKRRL